MKIINKDFEELKEPKYEIVFNELHDIIIKYFESIGITKWRHSLKCGIIANIIGVLCAIILSILFFGI